MAIAASRAPNREVNSPGSPVNGWTYRHVLVDMVDYMAYGQNDSGSERGGWGYYANYQGWSDDSNSGYAVLGLGYAGVPLYNFNCTVPQFVKDELKIWIDYIQVDGGPDDGGSACSPNYDLGVNILRTGNLIFQMTFVGRNPDEPNFQRALGYIGRKWNDSSRDPGWGNPAYGGTPHCQAMYCVMHGLEYANINTIVVDGKEIDWYADFANALVNTQQCDCSFWPNDPYGGKILATEWALLTLEKTPVRAHELLCGDINRSCNVNFVDFALFAEHWRQTDCGKCGGADLNCDEDVDTLDLREFAEGWLAGTVF
jgi:hypothetical protein